MSLKLTVLLFENQSVVETDAVFISGGSVGRSEDNTLVLPDSGKSVSRHHATISKENGCYYLSDNSLGGTYVGNREEPLHNATEPVYDGTILRIGKYEVIVSIFDEETIDEFPFFNNSMAFESKAFLQTDEFCSETENVNINSLFVNHGDSMQKKADEFSIFESSLQNNQSPLFDSYIAPNLISVVTHDEDIPENLSFDDFFSDSGSEIKVGSPLAQTNAGVNEENQINNGVFNAFLQGVAVECAHIYHEQQQETLHRIGQIFRKLIDGVVTVLRSRAEFKSLCRLNMTTIKATNNNPLKFTVSTDDVLRQLIENKTDGFLASTTAVEEAFGDIMNHQLAMQAGVQASLMNLLKTFDPKIIEKQFEQGIVLQKKSKCWDSYEETYRNTVDDAVENFFGDEFINAYEKQMKLLTNSKVK